MSAFLKSFLRDDIARPRELQGRQILLAAFGKHPGWDDHIKDVPIDSASLMTAWYHFEDGIKAQIDTGAWKRLGAGQGLIEFDHVFLWRREHQFLLGTLWSSHDTIGRSEYPMALCLHGLNVPLRWALITLLPKLLEVRQTCRGTEFADDVRAALQSGLQEMRRLLAALPGSLSDPNADPEERSRFFGQLGWPAQEEKPLRLLHQIRTQMTAYSPRGRGQAPRTSLDARRAGQGTADSPNPQHVRVPANGTEPAEVLFQWADLFSVLLDRTAPVLFLWHAAGNWVDVVVGEPSNKNFFALRAGPGTLAMAGEASTPLDLLSQDSGRKFIDDFLEGTHVGRGGKRKNTPVKAILTCGFILLLLGALLRFAPAKYIPPALHNTARWLGNPECVSKP